MKKDLYIDCDGVILDTIVMAFSEMELLGIDTSNELEIDKYFQNVNWKDLIERSGEINDSCRKIIALSDSNIFRNVAVLTHHCSYNEGKIKKDEFDKSLPNIQVFNVPKKIPKHFAVKANNNILVDDSKEKIIGWVNAGGIGVLFKKNIERFTCPSYDVPYFIINDLNDLIFVNNIINEYQKSMKVKRR